jgi:uncharacterized protein
MLHTFLLTAWGYVREILEIAVLGFVVAGVIDAVVNKTAVVRYLSGSLLGANLLGALVGIVTPLCCCSAIPTAMALYRAGSRRGPACAFLISTPWFNWYGLTALLIFLGPRVALAVDGSAVLIGFCTGVAIDRFGPRAAPASLRAVSTVADMTVSATDTCTDCDGGCCQPDEMRQSRSAALFDFTDLPGKLRTGVRFAVDMLREIGPWMLAGVLLGAAAETFVPEEEFSRFLGGASLLGLLAALVVAIVFSGDSLGSLPWVQSLLAKGLGAGSAMTLLVAGVGTNVSTLGPVARLMGRRTATLYAISVMLLAVLFGFALNRTV